MAQALADAIASLDVEAEAKDPERLLQLQQSLALKLSRFQPAGVTSAGFGLASLDSVRSPIVDPSGSPRIPGLNPSGSSSSSSGRPLRGDIDVASAGVKAVAEYPLLKQGEDFATWLSGFTAKAAAIPHLSDESKLDLLALRLNPLGASLLRMIRPRPALRQFKL